MGSLMAGWNTPFKDPKTAVYQRNKSLTRGEIDAYWKSKKKAEEEHLSEVFGSQHENQENLYMEQGGRLQRSSSLPLADSRGVLLKIGEEPGGEKFSKSSCWWTRSNSAFLNEPPVVAMEGPSYKYASQYHVTEFADSSNAAITT